MGLFQQLFQFFLGQFQQLFQFFQLPPFFPFSFGGPQKQIWKKKIVKMKINTHSLDQIKNKLGVSIPC